MRLRRAPVVVAAVFTLATLGTFGPHLVMLGYKIAGAKPPAGLVLFCPLHSLDSGRPPEPAFALHAKPFSADRS
jgi:hypothetical protein